MASSTIVATLPKAAREVVQVALAEVGASKRIDVRIAAELSVTSGIFIATKKGVSLNIEHLPALRAALDEAQAKAEEMGWLQ